MVDGGSGWVQESPLPSPREAMRRGTLRTFSLCAPSVRFFTFLLQYLLGRESFFTFLLQSWFRSWVYVFNLQPTGVLVAVSSCK